VAALKGGKGGLLFATYCLNAELSGVPNGVMLQPTAAAPHLAHRLGNRVTAKSIVQTHFGLLEVQEQSLVIFWFEISVARRATNIRLSSQPLPAQWVADKCARYPAGHPFWDEETLAQLCVAIEAIKE
jgi:hypothetical protein